MLSFKDKIPTLHQSHIVYKFTCNGCNAIYYGLCERHTKVRWADHMAISWRTGLPNVGVKSEVKDHMLECDTPVIFDCFNIIARDETLFRLRIKESLFIKMDDPLLNKQTYSTPLFLFYSSLDNSTL